MSFTCNQLINKYPKLFINGAKKINCGGGWVELLSTLLYKINLHAEQNNLEVTVLQVKEKFGGLRFYISGNSEYINGLISMAEGMSFYICEYCGERGESSSKSGWIKTKCKECQKINFQ